MFFIVPTWKREQRHGSNSDRLTFPPIRSFEHTTTFIHLIPGLSGDGSVREEPAVEAPIPSPQPKLTGSAKRGQLVGRSIVQSRVWRPLASQ